MEAAIRKEGEITIVTLKGYLDFETSEPFKKTCFHHLIHNNVIFDLRGLNFIGSSGLTPFIEVLRLFSSQNSLATKFCGLNSEFRRFFFANFLTHLEIYEDAPSAYASFFQPIQQIPKIHYSVEAPIVAATADPNSGIEIDEADAEDINLIPETN